MKLGQRPGQVAGFFAGRAAIDVGGGVVRVDPQHRVIVGQRPGQVAVVVQQRAAVVQHRRGERAGRRRGPVIVVQARGRVAQGVPGPSAVGQRLGVGRADRQRLAEVGDGLGEPAEPMEGEAGVVPGLGEVGDQRDRLAEASQGASRVAALSWATASRFTARASGRAFIGGIQVSTR